jgi:Phasin protein
MAKARTSGNGAAGLPQMDLSAFNSMFGTMAESFGDQQRTVLHTAERMAEETFRFWSRRMGAYAEHLRDMQACSGPSEYLDLGSKFLNRTLVDYGDETGQMMKMGQDAVVENAEALEGSARHEAK